jgi:hypothetical protein
MFWPALSACTANAPTAPAEQPPRALVAAEARSDVGNDRPRVSFDGLMVRHRIVLAVRLDPTADLAALLKQIDRAATHSHTSASPISAGVLDPVPLEQLAPDLVVALPREAILADGHRLMDPVLRQGRWSSVVQAHDVMSALVHDLRFTVRTARPAALSSAIAREGILSDALGTYATALGVGKLDILYTGPLLSDGLLHSVRAGIARRAGVAPAAVAVGPRSSTGAGVDMTQEPTPAPAEDSPSSNHHDH